MKQLRASAVLTTDEMKRAEQMVRELPDYDCQKCFGDGILTDGTNDVICPKCLDKQALHILAGN